MNDELQKALAASIGKVVNAAEAGASFLQVELPEVIRQLLVWKACEYGVHGAVLFGLGGWLFIKSYCWFREIQADDIDNPAIVIASIGCAISAVMIYIGAWKFMHIVQILVAPKVYLIEFAASLAAK